MTGFESKRQASKSLVANPWREAIDAELVCLHLGTVDSFPDAGAALNALIDWHVATALDPEVSSAAQALVDRGAAQPQAEPVAWRRYNRSIGWQYEDGVTSFASDPSAEPLYAAPQAAVAEPLTIGLDSIMGACSRGWCHPKNERKEMDADLAVAIAHEVKNMLIAYGIGIKGSKT